MTVGDRHTDGGGKSAAQGSGGDINTGGVTVFGMTGGLGAELTEVLQIVHGQAIAEQVQQAVHQHGAVAGREDEAVAVGPLRVCRVVLHILAPYGISGGRGAHGHSGVAGVGLLNGLGGENANGIDDHLFMIHGNALLSV